MYSMVNLEVIIRWPSLQILDFDWSEFLLWFKILNFVLNEKVMETISLRPPYTYPAFSIRDRKWQFQVL